MIEHFLYRLNERAWPDWLLKGPNHSRSHEAPDDILFCEAAHYDHRDVGSYAPEFFEDLVATVVGYVAVHKVLLS